MKRQFDHEISHFLGNLASKNPCWEETDAIAAKCVNCKRCVKECAFLQAYGTPGEIAAQVRNSDPEAADRSLAFECSLCGLCTAVCPLELTPAEMFLEMRRLSDRSNQGRDASSCVYLGFERRGLSPHFTHYALPEGCRTVLFPGCGLATTRPQETFSLFEQLRRNEPTLGIVLDCCTKPSHDLGRTAFFEAAFGELRSYLVEKGVRRVLTACPSCDKVFRKYGGSLTVQTVYETLAVEDKPGDEKIPEAVTIHDPCPFRFEKDVQGAVRKLLDGRGIQISEMRHKKRTTFCCGEGGSVRCTAPALAQSWSNRRIHEARGKKMVTYCTGCVAMLGKTAPTIHMLDILYGAPECRAGNCKTPRFPQTCWNRLTLKHRIKQHVPAAVSRQRDILMDSETAGKIYNTNWWTGRISRVVAAVFSLLIAAKDGRSPRADPKAGKDVSGCKDRKTPG
jgi:Fe-S oxidoreductase